MNQWAIRALRVVIALALLGSVVVQAAMVVSLLVRDATVDWFTVTLVVIGVLGVITLQVVGLSIWRLLTMVRRGTVFSHAAFRYVDRTIAALAAAAILIASVAVVARFANHAVPEDEVPPGVVALILGMGLVFAGVSLVVYVMRMLLAQAVDRDAEARHLQAELDEVI